MRGLLVGHRRRSNEENRRHIKRLARGIPEDKVRVDFQLELTAFDTYFS